MTTLPWLPKVEDFRPRLRALADWPEAVGLANTRLDFLRTNALDAAAARLFPAPSPGVQTKPIRLAVLGSATTAHLLPGLRVAALRRGIHLSAYEGAYGQYLQEMLDPASALHRFGPTAILFSFDARHATRDDPAASLSHIRECWRVARAQFGCPVLQQTLLNVFLPVLGSNEHRLEGSGHAAVATLNTGLRGAADSDGVALVAIDDQAARDGLSAWHDAGLWHRSKQDIALPAAPLYGELVVRVLAAQQGLSRKCLVLDLDNTLWGGVIGDDGLHGITLGQGSPLGEAYVALQAYARDLACRGVILAVCSKNDPATALEPFAKHPDMVLRRHDIASFQASWNDKPAGLRAIAAELNIGLDSLVFLDDNPFERALVRSELPMVAVPDVGDDPVEMLQVLAAAGYFEALAVTADDTARGAQYQGNVERAQLQAATTDLGQYLESLRMVLEWRRFDALGASRIVQLINKTNQFNLTTRRYTEAELDAVMQDNRALGLQLRLLDRFGDNGIIAIVIGRLAADGALFIDTWLMSCRVLGRDVEAATLGVLAAEAVRLGAARLIGCYRPTAKNAMVAEHYPRLGFSPLDDVGDGGTLWQLDLAHFVPPPSAIVVEGPK